MFRSVGLPALFTLLLGIALPYQAARAQDDGPVAVTSGVTYERIGTWDAGRLNHILEIDTPQFFGVDVAYTAATNGVRLYRIIYNSVVPERGNAPIAASGLLAIPDTGATSFPMVSYQHGTVYERRQVPSYPEQSPETQLMLAQFGGQGYVVIGADYFGMGISTEPEGYMVKASHQQATYDMLMASRAVLAHMQIETPHLFLGGWSQGGFVTMAMLEKLESAGVTVAAAATASAPVDVFAALSGFLVFPRPNDADWVTSLFILSSFSFENYYGVPGLARSLINDDYYEIARKAYEREPFDVADVPSDVHALVRADYFNPHFFANSAYGRLVSEHAHAYRWVIGTLVRNYYGEADEAISVGIGQLAATYQHAIGAGNEKVQAVSAGQTSHRGTYASSVPAWKEWFDSLLAK
jgi:hypothetical protein